MCEVPNEDCETEKRLRSISPALSIASTVPYSDDGWPSFDIADYDNTGLRFSVRVISICIRITTIFIFTGHGLNVCILLFRRMFSEFRDGFYFIVSEIQIVFDLIKLNLTGDQR